MSDDPIFLRSLRLCERSFSQMFIAYCVVYFSPSRKGRKDYIHSQDLCTLCAANVCSVLDNAGIFLLKKEAGIL